MRLTDLPTPCALVDLDRMEANCARMRGRARHLGVVPRPHVKTHKCVEGARIQGGERFTVSTLSEARALVAAGFSDLTWAVPVNPSRLPEVAAFPSHVRLALLVDHPAVLACVEQWARGRGRPWPVFLKVDCGYHRAGVDPADPLARELVQKLSSSPHLDFRGLLTHGGHVYGARTREERLAIALAERDVPVGLARELRREGVGVEEISIGSTPTLAVVPHLEGVTEIRPGNYVFHDAFQVAIGTCGLEDVAFSVLSTVISVGPGRAVLDAGALSLSKDPGAGDGFGVVADLEGRPLPARLHALSQEHGHMVGPWRPAPGDRARVFPNHSCLSAACFDRFHGVRGDRVVETWVPARGW